MRRVLTCIVVMFARAAEETCADAAAGLRDRGFAQLENALPDDARAADACLTALLLLASSSAPN